jgi:hypothetical protein
MVIRGGLSGDEVELQFCAQEDLRWSEHAEERQPQNWTRLMLNKDEARALLHWLRADRATDFSGSSVTARSSAGGLIIEGAGPTFAICLGTGELVTSLGGELSGALALITGHAVNPSS